MNHKERIRAVLAGQQPDRLPVATWGHDFLREWSAEELAAHTVERQRKYGYDFVKLNPRWTMFAEPWGNEYQPPTTQEFPKLLHKIIDALPDLRSVPHVGGDHRVFQEHVQALRLVLEDLGDTVDVVATLFSPLAVLGLLCGGVGRPLTGYADEDPEAVHVALAHITEALSGHAQDLVQAGASGIFYAALQWTSLDVCDEAFFDEFGRPYDLRLLEKIHGAPLNMFHVCGNNIQLERFFDYPVPIFNWDNFGPGNLTLAEASSLTDKVIAGGIPHRKLHKIDEQELLGIANEAIEGVEGRLILAGGCGVGASIDDDIRHSAAELPPKLRG